MKARITIPLGRFFRNRELHCINIAPQNAAVINLLFHRLVLRDNPVVTERFIIFGPSLLSLYFIHAIDCRWGLWFTQA